MARRLEQGSRVRVEDVGERWPDVPDDISLSDLEPQTRRDLRGLSAANAEFVGLHLLAAVLDAQDDPDVAWRHARAARSRGGRIAVVRETVGLVAYRAGEWAEAIQELRAARRMGGGPGHVAVMADCERALGNPERALELSRSPEAEQLDEENALELRIVVAAARADLGQLDAALAHLAAAGAAPVPGRPVRQPRLTYAYADLLERMGRDEEALAAFLAVADADDEEETDAGERLTALADRRAGRADADGDADAATDAADAADGAVAAADATADDDGTPVDGTPVDGDAGADEPTPIEEPTDAAAPVDAPVEAEVEAEVDVEVDVEAVGPAGAPEPADAAEPVPSGDHGPATGAIGLPFSHVDEPQPRRDDSSAPSGTAPLFSDGDLPR
ncbi:hypothetical protein [Nakamurella leprariae]|nr:hypothetical protein [Nakamurella leprariae]